MTDEQIKQYIRDEVKASVVNEGQEILKLFKKFNIDPLRIKPFADAAKIDGQADLSAEEVGLLMLASTIGEVRCNCVSGVKDLTEEEIEHIYKDPKILQTAKNLRDFYEHK